jgi:hypothetical protein
MRTILANLAVVILCFFGGTPAEHGHTERFKQIYSKAIGARNQTFVVSTGPDIDLRLFNLDNPTTKRVALRGNEEDHVERVFEVRAELVTPGEPTVLLASFLRCEASSPPSKGFSVLDCLARPNGFVVGLAEGSELQLWNVGTAGGGVPQTAPLANWSEIQLLRAAVENRPSMKIEQDSGIIQVTVTEGASAAVTHYTQANSLVFVFTRTDGPTVPKRLNK